MRRTINLTILLILLAEPGIASAQDQVVVPGGTLFRCALDEPNFSSKTAEVGDPVICNLSGLHVFGVTVFPRGAYLGGHLEEYKDPGHFFGKGYLQVEFDHIGLPNVDLPVSVKVIAAQKYKVNRQGDIVGRGHATRDAIEWTLPPLWPMKILTLPARGPRPTLKGETTLTLRLMDDVTMPLASNSMWPTGAATNTYGTSYVPPNMSRGPNGRASLASQPATPRVAASPTTDPPPTEHRLAHLTILVLKDDTALATADLQRMGDHLNYTLPNGTRGALKFEEVDWVRTRRENALSGSTIALRGDGSAR